VQLHGKQGEWVPMRGNDKKWPKQFLGSARSRNNHGVKLSKNHRTNEDIPRKTIKDAERQICSKKRVAARGENSWGGQERKDLHGKTLGAIKDIKFYPATVWRRGRASLEGKRRGGLSDVRVTQCRDKPSSKEPKGNTEKTCAVEESGFKHISNKGKKRGRPI